MIELKIEEIIKPLYDGSSMFATDFVEMVVRTLYYLSRMHLSTERNLYLFVL